MRDRHAATMPPEDGKLAIEDLHVDVGEKYLLCQTRKASPKRAMACAMQGCEDADFFYLNFRSFLTLCRASRTVAPSIR